MSFKGTYQSLQKLSLENGYCSYLGQLTLSCPSQVLELAIQAFWIVQQLEIWQPESQINWVSYVWSLLRGGQNYPTTFPRAYRITFLTVLAERELANYGS